ncbi:hypothetical protein TrRE_jg1643, partial [Triparma retinervis]
EMYSHGDYQPSMGMVDEKNNFTHSSPTSSPQEGRKVSSFHGVRLGSGVAVVEGSDVQQCKIMSSTMPRAYETATYDSSCWVEQR